MRAVLTLLSCQLVGLLLASWELTPLAVADHATALVVAKQALVIHVAAGCFLGLAALAADLLARSAPGEEHLWYSALASGPAFIIGNELFSGAWVSRQAWAPLGPYVLAIAGCAGVFLLFWCDGRIRARHGGLADPGWALLGMALVWLNGRVLTDLYPVFHDALLLIGWLCGARAVSASLWWGQARFSARRFDLVATAVAALLCLSVPLSWYRSPNIQHRARWDRHPGTASQLYGRSRRALRNYELHQLGDGDYAGLVELWLREANLTNAYKPQDTLALWSQEQARTSVPPRATARTGSAARPHILLVTVDTLRQDVEAETSAESGLGAFASQARRFARAYAPAASTKVSLPVLATGQVDWRRSQRSILTQLREAGYRTALITPERAYNWLKYQDQPWIDHAEQVIKTPNSRYTAPGVTAAAKQLLGERGDARPLFVWTHYFDTHEWATAKKHKPGQERAAYRAMWLREGKQVAAWMTFALQMLPAEGTAVIFTSDHGEHLGDGGRLSHGRWLDRELTRIPMWVRAPGHPAEDVGAAVGLVDISPTIAQLAGLHTTGMTGTTLLSAPPADRVLVMGETKELGSVRNDHRLVISPSSGLVRVYNESNPAHSALLPSPPAPLLRGLLAPLLGSPLARRFTCPLEP